MNYRRMAPGVPKETGEMAVPCPVAILEARQNDRKVHLKLAMSDDFHARFYGFLEERGFLCYGHEKPGIALLIDYGLSEESRDELARNVSDMEAVMSRYAATRYRVHDCYEENSAIASGLRIMLAVNKSLKRRLKEAGLGNLVDEDDWDSWGEETVSSFYRKYVFCK